jgi:acetyl-CoA synthetase
MTTRGDALLESLLQEDRKFPPPAEFKSKAHVKDDSLWKEADRDFQAFWGKLAEKEISWFKKWNKVLDGKAPSHAVPQKDWYKWFTGAKLNVSYNCVDRHAQGWRRTKAAIVWEGEPGDTVTLTYQDLQREVSKAANMLKAQGVKKGDRVTLYTGMVPELAIAMLACARIGAMHSVVFGGFSAEALKDRIQDAQSNVLITQDGAWRRGGMVPLKHYADQAAKDCPSLQKVIVVQRMGHDKAPVTMIPNRDFWWHEEVAKASPVCPPEQMDSEDPLFILYTSGTTGKPKGILHTTGGYLLGAHMSTKWVFDMKDDDYYWCTADIGWVTGHTYIVYGPLSNGATTIMYEGAPNHPAEDRFWALVEKFKVSILYTSPTAIRTFMKWGDQHPNGHDLGSLRLLGTVGEPINPEAWIWYHKVIGKERCPIMDTWWQTETGSAIISPIPGYTSLKPGTGTVPLPGYQAKIVDEKGVEVPPNSGGYLLLTRPWPSMLRTIWGDEKRYVDTYWTRFPGFYFTGDGARRDKDGYIWITGRVDDVVKVSGHRLSNIEIESALVAHPAVAEAATVGRSDATTGEAVAAFVVLKQGQKPSEELKRELRQWVGQKIGPIARPQDVFFSADLPKTRSAKIMRRLLRDIAEGKVTGDTTTLADPGIVEEIRQRYIKEGKEEA